MNEPIEEFKTRFNKALSIKNIKPTELAEKTGLSRSTISHYMSGYTKPKSDKLFILSSILNVSEQWLMGLDVPMEKTDKWNGIKEYFDKTNAFEAQLKILGWKCEFVGCQDWVLIDKDGMGLNNEGEIVPNGKGRPIGCERPDIGNNKCENCPDRFAHYVFTNGEITFKVSPQDYDDFISDAQTFFKERLQLLLKKSMKAMFSVPVSHVELRAAHNDNADDPDQQRLMEEDLQDMEDNW